MDRRADSSRDQATHASGVMGRDRVLAAFWAVLAIVVFAGCSTSHASPAGVGRSASDAWPTLSGCVQKWNRATFDYGRFGAKVAAANTPTALMVAFSNGTCGLAFPSRVPESAVFITVLSGDYSLEMNPLGMVGPTYEAGLAFEARLQARADKETNVRVEASTGTVNTLRNARMPTMPLTIHGANECAEVYPIFHADTANNAYVITNRTVGCPLARTLIWAWNADEAVVAPATTPRTAARILGWRCVGADLGQITRPPSFEHVRCTSGPEIVEARVARAHVNSET
jgi:hypothetical protein